MWKNPWTSSCSIEDLFLILLNYVFLKMISTTCRLDHFFYMMCTAPDVSSPRPVVRPSCHRAKWYDPREASHAPTSALGSSDWPENHRQIIDTFTQTFMCMDTHTRMHTHRLSYQLYLCAGVAHVADNAAVLQFVQMFSSNHIFVACRTDQNLACCLCCTAIFHKNRAALCSYLCRWWPCLRVWPPHSVWSL